MFAALIPISLPHTDSDKRLVLLEWIQANTYVEVLCGICLDVVNVDEVS
jgi:hypothetical protein